MTRNVGTTERYVRIVLGLVVLSLVLLLEGTARWWGLLGLVPLGTGLAGYCPLYALLGISTCRKKPAGQH
jgi:hypothetical protein